MEEADILGDRIAIVHMGRLRSYGTSMFLKKLLGNNYGCSSIVPFNLVVFFTNFTIQGHGHIEVTLSTESWCDPQRIRDELDPRGQILNTDGGKMVLSIPYSHVLPDSLDRMELRKKELGVTGMSVSLITLEQVFLKYVR